MKPLGGAILGGGRVIHGTGIRIAEVWLNPPKEHYTGKPKDIKAA